MPSLPSLVPFHPDGWLLPKLKKKNKHRKKMPPNPMLEKGENSGLASMTSSIINWSKERQIPRSAILCVLFEGTYFNLEINSKASNGSIHKNSKSCDFNEVLKLTSNAKYLVSRFNPKVDSKVPKPLHNPKVDNGLENNARCQI
jgi:hypothetical protein